MAIHPTAIIEPGAKISDDAYIGAYCTIGSQVEISSNVRLESHISISGCSRVGEGTHIFPFASIGHAPQDLKYRGEESRLEIGKNNIIREHVTINPGTSGGGMLTSIGNNCLFMVGSHVAHDCRVGNNVILANNATLAGHVEVGDYAVIGGLSAIHQFVRIGAHAMIGGMSGIESDIIPYGNAYGERASLRGLNLTGMERRGFGKEEINAIRQAFSALFDSAGEFAARLSKVEADYTANPYVLEILKFIRSENSRGLCHPKATGSMA